MIGDGVLPLINFAVSRPVLGTAAEIEAWAEHAGQLEDGLVLLDELDQLWGRRVNWTGSPNSPTAAERR